MTRANFDIAFDILHCVLPFNIVASDYALLPPVVNPLRRGYCFSAVYLVGDRVTSGLATSAFRTNYGHVHCRQLSCVSVPQKNEHLVVE